MRVLIALALLALLTTFAPPSLHRMPAVPARSAITFEPIPLNAEQPLIARAGNLQFLGGWALESNDPRFGGLSAMHVEGNRILALSDRGLAMRFALPGRGITDVLIWPLKSGPGSGRRRGDRDFEALVVAEGHAWIAFEDRNAVWRYDSHQLSRGRGTAPPAMKYWPKNGGAEAMLRLPDGRFLIFSEKHFLAGAITEALLFNGDPSVEGTPALSFRVKGPPQYRVTDAAMLSDGRILLLHRHASLLRGLSAKLSVVELPEFKDGMLLEGREIATLAAPLATSNYEALSVTRENGRDTIWVASDDNFSPLLRTLLLKFQFAS